MRALKVSPRQLRSQLAALLHRVRQGQVVQIVEGDEPVARLVPEPRVTAASAAGDAQGGRGAQASPRVTGRLPPAPEPVPLQGDGRLCVADVVAAERR